MKWVGIGLGAVGAATIAISMAFANPALLPNHPGYPAAGKSPVTGQDTANDPGQTNASGKKALLSSQRFGEKAAMNDVEHPNRPRIKKSRDASAAAEVDSAPNVSDGPGCCSMRRLKTFIDSIFDF